MNGNESVLERNSGVGSGRDSRIRRAGARETRKVGVGSERMVSCFASWGRETARTPRLRRCLSCVLLHPQQWHIGTFLLEILLEIRSANVTCQYYTSGVRDSGQNCSVLKLSGSQCSRDRSWVLWGPMMRKSMVVCETHYKSTRSCFHLCTLSALTLSFINTINTT